ncbi:MAG: glycoside hydrolase family 76 protein [Candidatus Dormibacteraceae bacterium]
MISERDNEINRRAFGKSATAALGAPLLANLQIPLTAGCTGDVANNRNSERAIAAYEAMQRQFYVAGVKLYRPTSPPSGNSYSYVWPFSQALVATMLLSGLPRGGRNYKRALADRVSSLAHYWNPAPISENPPSPPAPTPSPGYTSYVIPPLGQGDDLFYDDNEWIGLAAIQQFQMTGDTAALARAKAIFEIVRYGWDTDSSHADSGGTYWTMGGGNHDRNTISNGPGAELGLHLYLITKENSYLDHSKQMLDWVNRYLKAPNGLYWDHINFQGTADITQWSYNQGVMLGATALLSVATGHRVYLDQAVDLAGRALDFYDQAGRLLTQDVVFNAIFFKNLLRLSTLRPNPRYRQALQTYADTLWSSVDRSTGLLAVPPNLLVQSGLVQLYALLAWDLGDYHLLASGTTLR